MCAEHIVEFEISKKLGSTRQLPQGQVEDLEERMETQKKAAASYEKQKTEVGKERDLLLDELEQMKQIKVCKFISLFFQPKFNYLSSALLGMLKYYPLH